MYPQASVGGRDRRGFSVVIILVVAMVAAAVIVFSLEQMGQRRIGGKFFTPRVGFGGRVVVSVGIPHTRAGLGDAGALSVARVSGDLFQCLPADSVGEGILFRGTGVEKYDDFEPSAGDAGLCVRHVGESTEKGFDGRCPFVQVVEVVHG